MNISTQVIILATLLASTVFSHAVFLWKLNALHDLLNSRLSELIQMTASASRAEGMEQGRANEALRHKELE